MAPFLASLDPSTEVTLGKECQNNTGRITQYYMENAEGSPSNVRLVGVLSAIVDQEGKPRILVLAPPDSDAVIARDIFKRQLAVLHNVMSRDTTDSERPIINRELWCSVSSKHIGMIYARIYEQTHLTMFNVCNKVKQSPIDIIAPEIPVSEVLEPLGIGSIVVCDVQMFRADIALAQPSAAHEVFARIHGIRVSHVIQMYRTEQ
ncbi:hypothetical protein C8F04DRAFT_1399062 [Mycena alexandri]|uniref:Uncharacterized protein n=1 Tax=Mycena alexandri TaxID=1745969 RepID=A0AAD6SJV3_9AGAR|nr:hypothetical protein C8F04DRAFT_1399062 [Mycena alexandri]